MAYPTAKQIPSLLEMRKKIERDGLNYEWKVIIHLQQFAITASKRYEFLSLYHDLHIQVFQCLFLIALGQKCCVQTKVVFRHV